MQQIPILTNNQLFEIFQLQTELNPLYDPTWYNTHAVKYLSAAKAELVEMLEEIEDQWKWYQHNPTSRPEKALFELVDVMHFLASYTLLTFRRDGKHIPLDEVKKSCSYADDVFVFHLSPHNDGEEFSMGLMAHLYNLEGELSKAAVTQLKSLGVHLTYMNQLCSGWLKLLGFTTAEYMEAHRKKNQLNRERATGGVMEGTYDKATERELTIYDRT